MATPTEPLYLKVLSDPITARLVRGRVYSQLRFRRVVRRRLGLGSWILGRQVFGGPRAT